MLYWNSEHHDHSTLANHTTEERNEVILTCLVLSEPTLAPSDHCFVFPGLQAPQLFLSEICKSRLPYPKAEERCLWMPGLLKEASWKQASFKEDFNAEDHESLLEDRGRTAKPKCA